MRRDETNKISHWSGECEYIPSIEFVVVCVSNVHFNPVQMVPSLTSYPHYAVILWEDLYP